MALVAESLIEEWLNRNGYFTIRGARAPGGGEIDLLGVSLREDDAIHVESTVSVDPKGYLTGGGLSKRTREEVQAEAEELGVEVKHMNVIMAELMDRKRAFVTSSEASGVAELLDIFCKETGC